MIGVCSKNNKKLIATFKLCKKTQIQIKKLTHGQILKP